ENPYMVSVKPIETVPYNPLVCVLEGKCVVLVLVRIRRLRMGMYYRTGRALKYHSLMHHVLAPSIRVWVHCGFIWIVPKALLQQFLICVRHILIVICWITWCHLMNCDFRTFL